MANSTAFLGCSHFYSNFEENLKLFGQLLYLIPSFLLIGRMIYVISWGYKDDYEYENGQFWTLYSIDLGFFGTTAWQLSYMQISMGITVITGTVTAYNLLKSHNSPNKITITWLIISIEYLIMGIIFCFFHMKSFGFDYSNLIFILVFFVWDGFNILNPLIMFIMNRKLRKQVIGLGSNDDEVVVPHK